MSKVSNASRKRAAKLGLLDTAGLVDPPVAGAAVHQSQRHTHASTTPHYAHAATQTDPSADVAWLFLQLSLAFGGGTAVGSPRPPFPPPPPAAATLPPASALPSDSSVDAPGALVDGSSGDGDGAGFEGSVRKLSVGAPLNDHCVSQDALLSSQPTNSAPPPGPYVPPPLRSRTSACSPAAATTCATSTTSSPACAAPSGMAAGDDDGDDASESATTRLLPTTAALTALSPPSAPAAMPPDCGARWPSPPPQPHFAPRPEVLASPFLASYPAHQDARYYLALLVRDHLPLPRFHPRDSSSIINDVAAWTRTALSRFRGSLASLALIAHVALLEGYVDECSSDPAHYRSFGDFAGFFTSYVQRCGDAGGLFPLGGADASTYPAFCAAIGARLSDPGFPQVPASAARTLARRVGSARVGRESCVHPHSRESLARPRSRPRGLQLPATQSI